MLVKGNTCDQDTCAVQAMVKTSMRRTCSCSASFTGLTGWCCSGALFLAFKGNCSLCFFGLCMHDHGVAISVGAQHTLNCLAWLTSQHCMLCRYDDLRNYSNERSIYLAKLRDTIEGPWQKWELDQVDSTIHSELSPSEVGLSFLGSELERGISAEVDRCAEAVAEWCCNVPDGMRQAPSFDKGILVCCQARRQSSLHLTHFPLQFQVKDALREAAAYDVDPELSPAAQYMRKDMGLAGYKHLLSVGA